MSFNTIVIFQLFLEYIIGFYLMRPILFMKIAISDTGVLFAYAELQSNQIS